MLEFMFETTRTVTDMMFAGVVERYPDIRFVVPHCGAALPVLADRVELFRSLLPGPAGGPPASLTTRQQLQRYWYDLAGTPVPTQVGVLEAMAGSGRLLYGSDFCFTPAPMVAHHMAALDAANLADHIGPDWRALTATNTASLLRRSQQ
jgi:predicted TIM-barrel fold metal-dependent hydrolase